MRQTDLYYYDINNQNKAPFSLQITRNETCLVDNSAYRKNCINLPTKESFYKDNNKYIISLGNIQEKNKTDQNNCINIGNVVLPDIKSANFLNSLTIDLPQDKLFIVKDAATISSNNSLLNSSISAGETNNTINFGENAVEQYFFSNNTNSLLLKPNNNTSAINSLILGRHFPSMLASGSPSLHNTYLNGYSNGIAKTDSSFFMGQFLQQESDVYDTTTHRPKMATIQNSYIQGENITLKTRFKDEDYNGNVDCSFLLGSQLSLYPYTMPIEQKIDFIVGSKNSLINRPNKSAVMVIGQNNTSDLGRIFLGDNYQDTECLIAIQNNVIVDGFTSEWEELFTITTDELSNYSITNKGLIKCFTNKRRNTILLYGWWGVIEKPADGETEIKTIDLLEYLPKDFKAYKNKFPQYYNLTQPTKSIMKRDNVSTDYSYTVEADDNNFNLILTLSKSIDGRAGYIRRYGFYTDLPADFFFVWEGTE